MTLNLDYYTRFKCQLGNYNGVFISDTIVDKNKLFLNGVGLKFCPRWATLKHFTSQSAFQLEGPNLRKSASSLVKFALYYFVEGTGSSPAR